MRAGTLVLELVGAVPVFEASGLPRARFDLRLEAGDCVLVETRDPRRASALADLCSGLLPLAAGQVRFLGLDWSALGEAQVGALRGRIGRIQQRGAWNGLRSAEHDILLPRLHHTRETPERIEAAALELARRFGLPGLPAGPSRLMSDTDLARAACVRAFLGKPSLLLLESPVTDTDASLLNPFFRVLTDAREAGAAALCLTRERSAWRGYLRFLTAHLRLDEQGLGRIGPH